jgi:hypothetical protein
MNPRAVVIPFFAILLGISSLADATPVQDGSSFERAIPAQGDYEHYVDWEWNYLHKNFFPGRGLPKEHALTQHKGRTYDKFVFGDRVVYFDVTRFAGQIFKKRTKSLEQLMKEMGIPIEKHK